MEYRVRWFALILLVPFTATVHAQVRTFVSTQGSDNVLCDRLHPCRTFNAAIAAVNDGGEVVALDTGGYGPMQIDKSVTVHGSPGIVAAISPTSGSAVTVQAPGAKVVLRQLQLNAQGAADGIVIIDVAVLHIEECVVSGFTSGFGVLAVLSSNYDVYIKHTILRGNFEGMFIQAAHTFVVHASLDHVIAEDNVRFGVYSGQNSRMSVRNSVAAGNRGLVNGAGFAAGNGGAALSLHNCMATGNSNGVRANEAEIRVSASMITNNAIGISTTGPGMVISHGNNSLSGNDIDGAFNLNIGTQ